MFSIVDENSRSFLYFSQIYYKRKSKNKKSGMCVDNQSFNGDMRQTCFLLFDMITDQYYVCYYYYYYYY